jgi:hypothetical protein
MEGKQMDWAEKRKLNIKKEASALAKALQGKTINLVETTLSWDGLEIDSIRIHFGRRGSRVSWWKQRRMLCM